MTAVSEALVSETHSVTLLLIDGLDSLPVAHSTVGRRFRPDRMHVTWTRRNGGPWRLSTAKTSGPVLRKDGSAGSTTGDCTFVGFRGEWRPGAPQWAIDAARDYAPEDVTP